MKETNDNAVFMYVWEDKFLDMAKYGAMNGHSPSYIAQMAELKGESRRQFLKDISNKTTKLGSAYLSGLSIVTRDIDTTIHYLQLQGDTDAMEISLKRERLEYLARIKEDLFGL